LQVAREKLGGVATGPPAYPNPEIIEDLSWQDLLDQGLVHRRTWSNRELEESFEGTLWEDDDPEAKNAPDDPYLDIWVIDLGPNSVARAVLSQDGFEDLQSFLEIFENDEPILVIDTARHGLVSEAFVRNTAPDWLSAKQGGFPVSMRDADLFIDLHDDLPLELHDAVDFGQALILRTDRRLGFDPTQPWELVVSAVREHGMFHPEVGSTDLILKSNANERFFARAEVVEPIPPWLEALRGRSTDLIVLGVVLIAILGVFWARLDTFAALRQVQTIRLAILGFVLIFVGWWGQGQLSIVTPLAMLQTGISGGSLAFLLYDPFSLMVWAAAVLGFFLWGRGLFCGWLCPFGILQEFSAKVAEWLKIPQVPISTTWDARLRWVKYVVLAALVGVTILAPSYMDKAAEVEPFKTAITTGFVREWYYAAYAVFWLFLSMVLFKGFCRYVCPLGALMAIGGLVRRRDWITRRVECGSPCQLCKVKCRYGAIEKTGEVRYDECFQCLDCITIHERPDMCVPLIIAGKRGRNGNNGVQVAAE